MDIISANRVGGSRLAVEGMDQRNHAGGMVGEDDKHTFSDIFDIALVAEASVLFH